MSSSKLMDFYLFDAYPENTSIFEKLEKSEPVKIQIFVSDNTPYESVLQIAKIKIQSYSYNTFNKFSNIKYILVLKYHTSLKTNGETRLDKL